MVVDEEEEEEGGEEVVAAAAAAETVMEKGEEAKAAGHLPIFELHTSQYYVDAPPMSDLVRVHLGGGFADPPVASAGQRSVHVATGNEKRAVFCKGSDIMAGPVFKGMDAYSIHKAFINNYVTAAGRGPPSATQAHHRTDADILRSTFR